jgi:phosphopentomutase
VRRAIIIVLDGVGAGPAPDSAAYGDGGSDTLGNLARAVGGVALPSLRALGLGNALSLAGMAPVEAPWAAFGTMLPRSAGKDSTSGHWEIAGVVLERPFPVYPDGFPETLLDHFTRLTERPVIANIAGSGTAIIERFGAEHMRTGAWIVYTSADSVFQIAAHESVVPLDALYAACAVARELLVAPHDVSRVIARPFTGEAGAFRRTSNRRDFSIAPPMETLLDALAAANIPRRGVGKVDDLFAGRSLTSEHTASNAEGIAAIERALAEMSGGLLFANLVDFDQRWGHRNDVPGFYEGLRGLDAALPGLLSHLQEDDLLFLTADHGNDPTTPSTDHSRERVPLLVVGGAVHARNLGQRTTFADVGATAAEWLGIGFRGAGRSFLPELVGG